MSGSVARVIEQPPELRSLGARPGEHAGATSSDHRPGAELAAHSLA